MINFLIQIRDYRKDYTQSDLYVDGERFCYILEDVGRPHGVKVYAETCIPEGVYDVVVSHSPRFQKDMILLYNAAGQMVKRFGVEFAGVRVHGGNDVDDSEGCPLAAYQTGENGKVWDRASDDLCNKVKQWIDKGEKVKWIITSE